MSSALIEEAIPKGSVEHIIIDVTDRLHNIVSLETNQVKYDVRERGSATWISQNLNAIVIGMRVFCLIDTSLAGYESGLFELFIHFTNAPEFPKLGPITFPVNA